MSEFATIATYSVFVASYVVFALGKFPGMKIDRPGAAIIGAVLMFMTGAVRVENSLRLIHFGTIVLLFSMMLILFRHTLLHIANRDVETRSRRPEIDRRHGAKLWRPFFVRHPLPFRFRNFPYRKMQDKFRCSIADDRPSNRRESRPGKQLWKLRTLATKKSRCWRNQAITH